MNARERRYLSYLLRLWPMRQNGCETWRASLENPHTGERRGFASLAALMDFLKEQIQEGYDKDQDKEVRLKI